MKIGILTDFLGKTISNKYIRSSDGYLGGSLILLESKILTLNTQNITFSNLDGDSDKFYFMLIKSVNGPNTSNGYVYFNGSSSNMFSAYHQNYYYSATGLLHTVAVYGNYWKHRINTPTGASSFDKIFIDAQSGSERFIYKYSVGATSTIPVTSLGTIVKWSNTTDNLTSISFEGDNANSVYAANSEFYLYKLKTNS